MGASEAARYRAGGTSFQRSGVRVPGLPVLPDNVERIPIPGGGSRAMEVEAGDVISVIDVSGLQSVELVHYTPDGQSDAGVLGQLGTGNAAGIRQTLASDPNTGRRVTSALSKAGFSLDAADSAQLFTGDSVPGEQRSVTVSASGLVLIAAPGGPMDPGQQNTPTEVVVFIERVRERTEAEKLAPPAPLADPVLDENIQPGNAVAYEVKAGQYIQILDVQGRECSALREKWCVYRTRPNGFTLVYGENWRLLDGEAKE